MPVHGPYVVSRSATSAPIPGSKLVILVDQSSSATTKCTVTDLINTVRSAGKDPFTLTGNGSRTYAAGSFVKRALVKPSSDLAAFKIGTTNGGGEIFDSTSILSGIWTVVELNFYNESGAPIYLTGITSSTDFIIYTE